MENNLGAYTLLKKKFQVRLLEKKEKSIQSFMMLKMVMLL